MFESHDIFAKLPSGSNFKSLIDNHQIFVDKTKIISKLASSNIPMFLSRPRRFGKSTVVSILEELYTHGVNPYIDENGLTHDSYFKNLDIVKTWQDPNTYNVIHFDFSESRSFENFDVAILKAHGIAESSSLNSSYAVVKFIETLRLKIIEYIKKFNLDSKINTNARGVQYLFDSLIQNLGKNSSVLLIDEYDYPLTHIPENFSKEEKEYYIQSVLQVIKDFYANLKANNQYFRKIFITGITRYKDSSIFTAGNSITDISFDPTYGTITGFTKEEISMFFSDHLCYVASKLNNIDVKQVDDCHIAKLIEDMASWYDGFSFSDEMDSHVFSTVSVIRFFSRQNPVFTNYWYEIGGIPTVLRNNVDSVMKMLKEGDSLLNEIRTSKDLFLNPSSYQNMDAATLLYQTGYLTLAKPFGNSNLIYLKVPNIELESSLSRLACNYLFNENIIKVDNSYLSFIMTEQDIFNYFNSILNLINYDHNPLNQESAVVNSLHMFFAGNSNYKVTVDNHTLKGRSDLKIDFDNERSFIFEFKFNKKDSNESDQKLLNEAVEQMRARDYLNYPDLKVRGFALVYNTHQRALTVIKEVI